MTETEVAAAYQRYGQLVFDRCRRILRESALADDASQETFLRLWRYGDSFAQAESKLGWLFRVADRCCFDVLDKRRARPGPDAPPLEAPASRTLEDREVVMSFLQRFDEKTRQVAIHRYLDEMTQDEIAQATGWSRQTVHAKLRHLEERAAALKASLLP